MSRLRYWIHKLLRRAGCDIVRYTEHNFFSLRRARILQNQHINVVLDVGANEGAYALEIREIGYKGRIISFEPLTQAYHVLSQRAARDPLWQSEHIAIGDFNGKTELNISEHSTSSSLLPITKLHTNAMPESFYMTTEEVRISRLDSVIEEHFQSDDRLYLKADVQGYEKHVLQGATNILTQIRGLEIELSLVPMYEDSPLLCEMVEYLHDLNFVLVALENVFSDPQTGHLLQVDGIFVQRL